MRRSTLLPVAAFLAGMGWLLHLSPEVVAGGKDAGERVRFTTADGFEIIGTYFQGKQRGATVMILHGLSENSRMKNYVNLAEELQKRGFCVLTFDFRGHGHSTEVDKDLFWSIPVNRQRVKPIRGREGTIEKEQFLSNYWPVLVNDIASAKAYLDRKNDVGACNTGSLVVIGAEGGATLGAIWQHSEWHRYKLVPNPMLPFGPPIPATKPVGDNTIANIWLSVTPKLGSWNVNVTAQVALAGRVAAVPMVFMYGAEDKSGKRVAQAAESYLKSSKEKDRFKYTGAFPIPKTEAKGVGLLQPGLNTPKLIGNWLDEVVLAKGNEWQERDFRKSMYIWRLPGRLGTTVPARTDLMSDNLVFDSYDRWVQR